MDWFDKEEDLIIEAEREGRITLEQAQKELRELRRAWQLEREERAQRAYDREMERY